MLIKKSKRTYTTELYDNLMTMINHGATLTLIYLDVINLMGRNLLDPKKQNYLNKFIFHVKRKDAR